MWAIPGTGASTPFWRALFSAGGLGDGAIGGGRIGRAEDGRAGDEEARARLGGAGCRVDVDSAVDLDRRLGQELLELLDLALGALDPALAAPSRVDGHAQHQIDD